MSALSRPWLTPAAILALVAALSLNLFGPPPVDAQSIAEARQERQAIQQRLDAAAGQLNDLEVRIAELDDETTSLKSEMADLQAVADAADDRVAMRVRGVYKRGIDLPILQMLGSEDAAAAFDRIELAGHLLTGDRVEFEQAHAARVRLSEVAEQLEERQAELGDARESLSETLGSLRADLDRAQALEARLVAEEQRRQEAARRRAEAAARQRQAAASTTSNAPAPAAAPARSSGARACPMGRPHSFTDTWGAPRGSGRSHKGVDILAPMGTPVYAIVDGVWNIRSYGNSAGHWAILRGSDGHNYYYMHLQRHVVGQNARVSAGQQVATNGDTGNARGTPHLHFEYHPNRGGPVNPTPLVRSVC